jgi:hypothetical protein
MTRPQKINLFSMVFPIVTTAITGPPKISSTVFFIVTAKCYVFAKIRSVLFSADLSYYKQHPV